MGEAYKARRHRSRSGDLHAMSGARRGARRKWPSWVVSDEFDQQMADWEEPPIRRYPGWLRVLILLSVSIGLWGLIITAVAVVLRAGHGPAI